MLLLNKHEKKEIMSTIPGRTLPAARAVQKNDIVSNKTEELAKVFATNNPSRNIADGLRLAVTSFDDKSFGGPSNPVVRKSMHRVRKIFEAMLVPPEPSVYNHDKEGSISTVIFEQPFIPPRPEVIQFLLDTASIDTSKNTNPSKVFRAKPKAWGLMLDDEREQKPREGRNISPKKKKKRSAEKKTKFTHVKRYRKRKNNK